MCGRYYFDIDDKELREITDAAQKNLSDEFKTGEIFPSDKALVITMQENKVIPIIAKWGFPKWNDKDIIINARAETLSEKILFKNLVKYNRCIVPASGFYEWNKSSSREKKKNKYYFTNPGSVMYMAGLYNTYQTKSEQISLFDTNKEQLSYVIITKNANEYMAGIHERMPLIFTKSEMERWLQGENVNTLLSGNQAKLAHTIIS